MEEKIELQKAAMHSIERALANFRKTPKSRMNRTAIQQRMNLLKTNFAQCERTHAELLINSTPEFRQEEKYFTDHLFINCEDRFYEALDYMAEKYQQLTPPTNDDTQESGGNNSLIGAVKATPHLPRISLPKFTGNFIEWETFRDHFRSVVVDNADLSDITRMHYLLSCLKGEPNDLIRNLSITDANFQVAWNLLLQHYDNKRRLVHEHLHVLNTLPIIQSESASDLTVLRDRTAMAVQALRNLDRSINQCSDFLVYLLTQRLDKATRKAWELKLGNTVDYPTYDELDAFLTARIRALENILPGGIIKPKFAKQIVQSHSTNTINCPVCHQSHSLLACTEFKVKSIAQRRELAQKLHRCFNCLGTRHSRNDCPSKHSCRICQNRHHTLLHEVVNTSKSEVVPATSPDTKLGESSSVTSHLLSNPIEKPAGTLLATAWIRVSAPDGRFSVCRALLDQGSAITLVTERLAQRLRLKRQKIEVTISGISGASVAAKHSVHIKVTARHGKGPSYHTSALILKSLTTYIPPRSIKLTSMSHISGLTLADHDPTSHDGIDILIGADLYGCVLLDGLRRDEQNQPVAQNTIFGWILSGTTPEISTSPLPTLTAHHCCPTSELTNQIRHFWEIEELPLQVHLTEEDQRCEEHFRTTHTRDKAGRYVLRLPFKQGPPIEIGESRYSALRSLQHLETRFNSHSTLADEYAAFLSEYENLGHMKSVASPDASTSQTVYIPHHPVIKESSSTTRVRVVFNASHQTSNGLSLNDHLMIGQKLQPDICAVLLRWRQFRYAYATDITKMYRQIRIDPRDINYQRILWKAPHENSVKEFQLLTVTYGTASAPYLALRVLQQLAQDEGANFPLAKSILQSHIYVDDCLFGADDKPLALNTRNQLIQLLGTAGFQLRKWASNCPDLTRDIDPADHGLASERLFFPDEHLKILGLSWNPERDTFNFQVQLSASLPSTKRNILSTIAKMYDPLGWLTPVIIIAKIFIQHLWLQKISWDETLPNDLLSQWLAFHATLPQLREIAIPRWIGNGNDLLSSEIHGFSDASSSAYGASVYLRLQTLDGIVISSLVIAKSKVAPLKPMSIPRLELTAALLLTRCVAFVIDTLKLDKIPCHCWTDSTVILTWIQQAPSK